MAVSRNTHEAYIKALHIPMGQKFYASDYELNSGHILALKNAGFIEKTGNAKTIMIPIYDDVCKEVNISEWVKVKEISSTVNDIPSLFLLLFG